MLTAVSSATLTAVNSMVLTAHAVSITMLTAVSNRNYLIIYISNGVYFCRLNR